MWRAVDHEGEVLEVFVTKRRDRRAALRFLNRAIKRYGRPASIVTDGLPSYRAAMTVIGNATAQTCGRWLNNRAENSHQPFRRREAAMANFRDVKTLQKFASVHASIHNHSHGKWLVKGRINSLCAWHSSAVMGSKSEPLSTTRPFAEPVKLTSGRRSHRLHQHPAFGGGGSGGRDHSSTRLFQPNGCPVRPPGSGEADQAPRNRIRDYSKLLGSAHDRTLRDDTCGHKRPQSDEQLTRQGDDHDALYGRLPERKDRFEYDGHADCSFVSGLWCGAFCPLALMESADPRLISVPGFSPLGIIQAWRIAV